MSGFRPNSEPAPGVQTPGTHLRARARGMRLRACARGFGAAALAVALCLLPLRGLAQGPAAPAGAPLPRVVSMNLCTDQLLLALAAPGQIVSLSHLARDPGLSVAHLAAQEHPVNHGRAEEIYLLHPDVVLADTWSDPGAVAMMRRLGLRVVQLDPGTSLAGIRARITEVGREIGQPEAAQAMLAGFDARLAAIARPAPGLRAAVYGTGGFGYGPGTLEGQILALAGFENIVSGEGFDYGGPLALERLVMARPDLVIEAGSEYATGAAKGRSRAQELLAHPVLAALPRRAGLRDVRWVCGAPAMLGAVEDLAALGRQMQKEKETQ